MVSCGHGHHVATSGSAGRGRGRAGTAVRPVLSRVLSREQTQAVLFYLTHLPFSESQLRERGWASKSTELCPSVSLMVSLETTSVGPSSA